MFGIPSIDKYQIKFTACAKRSKRYLDGGAVL